MTPTNAIGAIPGWGSEVYAWDARSLGMGGITSTQGGSLACAANPAMLASGRKYQGLVSLGYDRWMPELMGETGFSGRQSWGSWNLQALLVSVRQGKLAFGGGVYQSQEYDWQRTTYGFRIVGNERIDTKYVNEYRGGVYDYPLVASLRLTGDISVGVGAKWHRGDFIDRNIRTEQGVTWETLAIGRTYRGSSYAFGLACSRDMRGAKWLLSAVYKTPAAIEALRVVTVFDPPAITDLGEDIKTPPIYQLGLACSFSSFGWALEYSDINWRDADWADRRIVWVEEDMFTDVGIWRLGMEWQARQSLLLRLGGYVSRSPIKYRDPQDFSVPLPGPPPPPTEKVRRHFVTLGFGFLPGELGSLPRVLSYCELDIAGEYGWQEQIEGSGYRERFAKFITSLRVGY